MPDRCRKTLTLNSEREHPMRKPNFRYNSPYPQTRTARVVVPGGLIIPEELRLPPYLPDIVEPHEYRDDYVESYRRRERDHHRIKLTPRS